MVSHPPEIDKFRDPLSRTWGLKPLDITMGRKDLNRDDTFQTGCRERYKLLLEPTSSRLLIVTVVLRCALIRRCEEAEQTVRLVADAGGEEQPITRSSPLVVAKA